MLYKATISDIPEMMEIERASYSKPWDEQLFVQAVNSAGKHSFVSKIDSKIAGYIVFEVVADEGHITNIAVTKQNRRRGIATELIVKVLELVRDHHINSVYLEVRQSNEAAKKLYEKFGFKEIGERKGYYQGTNENALVYKLDAKK